MNAVALWMTIRSIALWTLTAPTPDLLTNGGMEAPLDSQGQPPGFSLAPFDSRTTAAGSFELVDNGHTGRRALKVSRSNSDSGYALNIMIPTFEPSTAPRRLLLLCWVKRAGDHRDGVAPCLEHQVFTPQWYGACKSLRTTAPHPYSDGWSKQAVLLEQLPEKTIKYLRFAIEVGRPGDGLIIDDVELYDVTSWSQPDIDAMMKPSDEGQADVPTDTQPARQGNLLENSSFELGLARGWSIQGPLPEEQLKSIDPSVARHGRTSLRLSVTPGQTVRLTGKFLSVRPHQTHTLSAWVRSDVQNASVSLSFENGYVPDHGSPHRVAVHASPPMNGWRRLSATGVTQPGPRDAYAVIITATGPTSGNVWVDAVQYEEGPLTDYRPRDTIEAALSLPDPTGISTWDTDVRYAVHIANWGLQAVPVKLRTEVRDFWNRPVDRPRISDVSARPGLTTVDRSHAVGARGSLRMKLWIDARQAPEDEATLTIVPEPKFPGRHPDSQFGQHARLEPWQLGVAKRLGAGWVRLHDVETCLSWDGSEPQPGQWVWADEKIQAAHRAGLEVLGVFGRPPAWAADERSKRTSTTGWFYPSDLNLWARYIETVARHYRGKVNVWEIWNEPCWAGFGMDGDGTRYAALAKVTYAAAKKGNPDCTVLGLVTSEAAPAFNRAALAGGAMQACDIVSWHIYTGRGTDVLGRGRLLREMLGLDRVRKDLWMTEGIGGYTRTWHSLLIDAVDDPYSRQPQAPKLTGEQAAVAGAIAIAGVLGGDSKKVFWYWSPWEGSGSIRPDRYTWFEYDGQLKPHAAACAVSAHFLDGTTPHRCLSLPNGLTACLFKQGTSAVAVLWGRGDGKSQLVLPDSSTQPALRLEVFDVMGNPILIREAGQITDRWPMYVTAKGAQPSDLAAIFKPKGSAK